MVSVEMNTYLLLLRDMMMMHEMALGAFLGP